MSLEKLVKPVRTKFETNVGWNARRDAYRMEIMQSQIAELQKAVKRLEKK